MVRRILGVIARIAAKVLASTVALAVLCAASPLPAHRSALAASLTTRAAATAPTTGSAPADFPDPARGVELRFEAAGVFAGLAEGLQRFEGERLVSIQHLVGLDDPGPPIRVLLAPEGSVAARAVPDWVAGYARGEEGAVVLLPVRSPSYPDSTLESVLEHEVAHVLIWRASRGRFVPRWFNEGLAMAASRRPGLEDRARLIYELLPGAGVRLAELDAMFDEGYGRATRAYTLAGTFVEDLLERAGHASAARILAGIRDGAGFEEAFRRATGMTLEAAEISFWHRQNVWNRWFPILASSFTLWTGITLLALWATKRRRDRDAKVLEQWKEEESVVFPEDPSDKHWVN